MHTIAYRTRTDTGIDGISKFCPHFQAAPGEIHFHTVEVHRLIIAHAGDADDDDHLDHGRSLTVAISLVSLIVLLVRLIRDLALLH